MVQTAVLGYGTVGSGVVKVIDTNHDSILAKAGVDLQVKYILDLREFPGDPNAQKVVHDVEVILQDPEVRIVVETMGGVEPAFTFTKRALMAGKSVCTSNKELVATHGTELLALARDCLLYTSKACTEYGTLPGTDHRWRDPPSGTYRGDAYR